MTAKQINEAKRAVRMQTFVESKKADFQHTPPHPGDQKYADTAATLDQAIADLGGKQAIQSADEYGQKTTEQVADRGDCESMLRKINTAVAGFAEETKNPALMDRFRMPHGDGDTELAGKLRSFGKGITDLNLQAELLKHFLDIDETRLNKMADDLMAGVGEQGAARGKQTGATQTIPVALKTVRTCKKVFDSIFGNVYEGNAAVLAEWKSVSHVPRDGGGEDAPQPAAQPAPAPAK